MDKRDYRPHTQRSFNDVEDVNLVRALAFDVSDEQLDLYRQNQHLRRSELANLLKIDKLTLNFIIYKMKNKPAYKSDKKPNPFAEKIIEQLKNGRGKQKICDDLDVAMSVVSYYNLKIKAGCYE